MDSAQKLRYDWWIERVRIVAHKYYISVKSLVLILKGIEDVKGLFNSVEAEDFICFYLRMKDEGDYDESKRLFKK